MSNKAAAAPSGSDTIECPLRAEAGELSRAEILDRLGVRDFARVAQLSAEEAFRLLQQKHSNDHQKCLVSLRIGTHKTHCGIERAV